MQEQMKNRKIDSKEFELPDTFFIRDIEDSVFQEIVVECLSKIEGIHLIEGNLIDSILGTNRLPSTKGIGVEQDNKNHSVSFKVYVNIDYGFRIPEKAEEIQSKLAEEVTRLTGLHVSSVHIIFKNMVRPLSVKQSSNDDDPFSYTAEMNTKEIIEQYTDEF